MSVAKKDDDEPEAPSEWSLVNPKAKVETLRILNLEIRCEIGFNPHEIGKPQRLLVSVAFQNLSTCSGQHVDSLEENAADLRSIGKDILQMEKRSFALIETVAKDIAYICTVVHGCSNCTVTVKKPGSLRFSEGTEVQVEHAASDFPNHWVLVSIGSNIEPKTNIPLALEHIQGGIGNILKQSRQFRSASVGSPGPDFLNMAVLVETRLIPSYLDRKLKEIETKLGRVRDPTNKNAPRTIDLDISFFNKDNPILVDDELLTTPHVVLPLADIGPDWVYPNQQGRSISQIATSLCSGRSDLPIATSDSAPAYETDPLNQTLETNSEVVSPGAAAAARRPVAFVTGGTSKLGRKITETLHQDGWNVAIHFNSDGKTADEMVADLNQKREGSLIGLQSDLSNEPSEQKCSSMVRKVIDAFGRLDLLVNNASIFKKSDLLGGSSQDSGSSFSADWTRQFAVNLQSPVLFSQAAFEFLANSGGGIVNITDIHGVHPLANHTTYCITKAGLIMATRSLALEMAPNVRVNAVSPGAIEWLDPPPPKSYQNAVLSKVPLHRMGTKGDIASAVLFLAKNKYITGEVVTVDGGRTNVNSKPFQPTKVVLPQLVRNKTACPELSRNANVPMDLDRIEIMYKSILESFGNDVNREGLLKTPKRATKAMYDLLSGNQQDLNTILNEALFEENTNEMVVVHGITFYSLCEHHLLPFFGQVHIAYIPNGKVIGLSKLPRIVRMFSKRLQVQERLTKDIASALQDAINPLGVAVVIDARHMCMEMRGVEQNDSNTSTRCLMGAFEKDQQLVAAFYEKMRSSRVRSRL